LTSFLAEPETPSSVPRTRTPSYTNHHKEKMTSPIEKDKVDPLLVEFQTAYLLAE
jgi:hypothetical protein